MGALFALGSVIVYPVYCQVSFDAFLRAIQPQPNFRMGAKFDHRSETNLEARSAEPLQYNLCNFAVIGLNYAKDMLNSNECRTETGDPCVY